MTIILFLLIGANLMQSIQMELSNQQKSFSQFFSAFLKLRLNVQHFFIFM